MDIKDITPEDSVVPIYLVPLTEEEELMYAELAKKEDEYQQSLIDAEKARQAAIDKLKKLGLTEQEIKAIISI